MKQDPQTMLICKLDCLLMPNGEIISKGKTLGWFKQLGEELTPVRHADGTHVKEGEFV